MNRDRQIVKDIQNKHAQAREQYEKNKSLMGEYKIKEKATEYVHSTEADTDDGEERKDVAKDKVSE